MDIPEDMVVLDYKRSTLLLTDAAIRLHDGGYIFIVNPQVNAIAMTREAADYLGVL